MGYQRLCKGLAVVCASLAIILSATVLVGWHTANVDLVNLALGNMAIHYHTALGGLLAGLALITYQRQKPHLTTALALPVCLIGLLHFVQFISKSRWHIDHWFHAIIENSAFTNTLNLAPTVSIALMAFGAALVWWPHREHDPDAAYALRAVCLSLFAICLVSSWALYDQNQGLYGWGNIARMAPGSILIFVLLGISGLCCTVSAAYNKYRHRFIQMVVSVLVPLVIGLSIMLWAALGKTEARHLGETIRQESAMTLSGLRHSLRSQAYSLRRMANRLARSAEPDLAAWRLDAEMYLLDHPGMIALARVSGIPQNVEWIVSEQAPQQIQPDVIQKALSEAGRASERLAISNPSLLREGSGQFIMASPASRGDKNTAVLAVFDGAALLQGVFFHEYLDLMHLTVSLGGDRLFETTAKQDEFRRFWAITDQVELLGKTWTLEVWPTAHYYNDIHTNLQDMVLVSGLIIAVLLVITSQLLLRSDRNSDLLRTKERQLTLLLDNAGEGIFGLDAEGRTTFLNQAAERITGYSAKQMLNKKQHSILHHSHADGRPYPEEECNIYRVLKEGGQHFERNEVFWRPDGKCYPVEYTSSAVVNHKGTITGAVTVFRDISELKEIENKLRAINEELENFAYLASHDLKAPLRVIHNASQWLKEDLAEHLRDEDRENLDLLQNRANRMERLLDDLLQYSRIGRVTDDRFREKISGTEMMENIVNLLATPEDVVLNISENFANIANARMPLQQILYNLIGNSIKHREGRSLRIDVDVKTVGDSYIFTVADNGPGIPAKYHQRIFDIFRTLKPRDQVEGSGIGLSVVKKYVTLYGGRIEVHSAVGEGCCFTITWPISPQQANR